MAKLNFLFAAVALFLLVAGANASIYQTTVVLDANDKENRPGQSCREHIQSQQQLRNCQMFFRSQCSQRRERQLPPYDGQENEKRHLRECCEELKELPTRCRCEGLEQALRRQIRQGEMEMEEMRGMYDMATRLPSMCRMPQMRCDFGRPRSVY